MEECTYSKTPLRAALELFKYDKQGNGLASEALDGSTERPV